MAVYQCTIVTAMAGALTIDTATAVAPDLAVVSEAARAADSVSREECFNRRTNRLTQ